VDGKEQPCSEGEFFFNLEGKWVSAGDEPVKAQKERTEKLARQEYEQTTGEVFPEEKKSKEKGLKLSDATDAFLAQVELKVAAKNRRPRRDQAQGPEIRQRIAPGVFCMQARGLLRGGESGTVQGRLNARHWAGQE
jgi:hypothetical protein